MKWYNEPPPWHIDDDTIQITSSPHTDFWRKTKDGLISDNGHFYYQPVQGNFCVQVNISGEYKEQYDQSGLMVRLDEFNWLKCGIELVDGVRHIAAVMTLDYSDASVIPIPPEIPAIWLRVVRHEALLEVFYSLDGVQYNVFRTAHFTSTEIVNVGVMCAAPTKGSLTTTLKGLKIESCE